jgi:hypothetical protein
MSTETPEFRKQISHTVCAYDAIPTTSDICPISLVNITPQTKAIQLIRIPSNIPGVYTHYDIDILNEYDCNMGQGVIPDPIRNFKDISFIRPRLKLQSHLKETNEDNVESIRLMDLTMPNRIDMLLKSISRWCAGEISISHAIFIGIDVFAAAGYYHTNTDAIKSIEILKPTHIPNKSYIIRESSVCSDGRGNCTVFTISIKHFNKVLHVRYIYVHGVGIYRTNHSLGKEFPSKLAKNKHHTPLVFETMELMDLIQELNNRKSTLEPTNPTILHELKYLHDTGIIKIQNILAVSLGTYTQQKKSEYDDITSFCIQKNN